MAMEIDEAVVAEVRKRREATEGYEASNAFPFQMLEQFGPLGFAVASYGPDDGESYYAMNQLPPDCPFPGSLEPALLIDRLWAPIAPKTPKFVDALKKACKHNLVLHRTKAKHKNDNGWFLGYILDRKETVSEGGGRYAEIWGRRGFERPKVGRDARRARFELPESLRLLYRIHNGIGLSSPRTRGVEAINSARNLERLPNQPLIELYCDSGGNRATYSCSGEDALVDWDRETHQTTKTGPLWKLFEEDILRYVTGDY